MMTNILRRLKIAEISSVDHAANPHAQVRLMKRDNGRIINDGLMELAEYVGEIIVDKNIVDKDAEITKCCKSFGRYLAANGIMLSKAENDPVTDDTILDDPSRSNTISDDDKVTARLKAYAALMIKAMPGLDEAHALYYLTCHPRGVRLAQHLHSFSKNEKEQPTMDRPQEMQVMKNYVKEGGMVAVNKRIIEKGSTSLSEWEYTGLVQQEATRKGISFEKAFQDSDTQHAYAIVRDAIQTKAYLKVNMMSVEPVSVETGSSLVSDDSAKAVQQLQELAEKQHRTFEEVFSDPANGELAGRTYTSAHRPTASSPSYDAELNR
jgi:hypothetical protein